MLAIVLPISKEKESDNNNFFALKIIEAYISSIELALSLKAIMYERLWEHHWLVLVSVVY